MQLSELDQNLEVLRAVDEAVRDARHPARRLGRYAPEPESRPTRTVRDYARAVLRDRLYGITGEWVDHSIVCALVDERMKGSSMNRKQRQAIEERLFRVVEPDEVEAERQHNEDAEVGRLLREITERAGKGDTPCLFIWPPYLVCRTWCLTLSSRSQPSIENEADSLLTALTAAHMALMAVLVTDAPNPLEEVAK